MFCKAVNITWNQTKLIFKVKLTDLVYNTEKNAKASFLCKAVNSQSDEMPLARKKQQCAYII